MAGASRRRHRLMAMTPALAETVLGLWPMAETQFRRRWWIIGSGAMALLGVDGVEPHDVDVLCDADDAAALIAAWLPHLDADYRPPGADRFRSCFARFDHLPLPLEVMGGLQVNGNDGWQSLSVAETERVGVGTAWIPVPPLREQRRILRLFGRDKDLAKAELISSHLCDEGFR